MISKMKDHWDTVYASKPVEQLGWYEDVPFPSLKMLGECTLAHDDPILDIGAGASTFIDCLIEKGFRNIIAADISEVALSRLKDRLGEKASQVRCVVDDVTKPTTLADLQNIALWHDRALLHFLLEERQREAYLSTLKQVLRPGGYVIVAAFSLKGVKKCSGLDVRNYDRRMLVDFLEEDFALIDCSEYTYNTPWGESRPYIAVCMQRKQI